MLIIDKNSQEFMQKVVDWAKKVGRYDQLKEQLDYLGNYSIREGEPKDKTICLLYRDGYGTPDFGFTMMIKSKNDGVGVVINDVPYPDYHRWFNGGLLFHGAHDGFGSGAGPTFAVTLNPTDGWSVRT